MFVRRNLLSAILCALCSTSMCFAAVADERSDRVDKLFSAWDGESPGAAVAISQGDNLLYFATFGLRNIESGEPITRDTRFNLASASKQFTAACVADLAHRGQLDLNDDVRKYITELPDYGMEITISHLIHHRSGLRDMFELMMLAKRDLDAEVTTKEVMDLVCRQESLQFEPGSDFLYSNTNYFLLAEIVQRVSGSSLREYADERIFTPLGMEHTEFRDAVDQVIPNLASGHENAPGGFRPRESKLCLPGSGGVYSTVDDLLLWQRNFKSANWGTPELLQQLQTPPLLSEDQRQSPMIGPYAFGLMSREYRGVPIVAALFGGSFGSSSLLMRFPNQDISIIVLANSSAADATELGFAVADIYLADELGAEPEPSAIKPPPGFALFQSEDDELLIYSTRPTGESHLTTLFYKVEIQAKSESRFESINSAIPVIAELSSDGGTRVVDVEIAGGKPKRYTALAIDPPPATFVESLAGIYTSNEVGADVQFDLVDGRLELNDDSMEINVAPFMAVSKELLMSDTGVRLDVLKYEDGKALELMISTPRARKILLKRK